MPRTNGRLHINGGISRLDSTRLIKDTNDNDGLGTATTFLQFNRNLDDNDDIFVDGNNVKFKNTSEVVILITNAGRRTGPVAFNLDGASTRGITTKAAEKATGKRAAKKPAKKAGAKKPAKKSAGKKRGKKASAKKTTKKAARKTAKTRKTAKKSRRNQVAAKKVTRKTTSRKK
jgi:hypothetical protein